MSYDPEYDGRMIAATRNIEALFVAVRQHEEKRVADAQRVEALMATVTQLTQDVHSLTNRVALLQAQLYEAGVR